MTLALTPRDRLSLINTLKLFSEIDTLLLPIKKLRLANISTKENGEFFVLKRWFLYSNNGLTNESPLWEYKCSEDKVKPKNDPDIYHMSSSKYKDRYKEISTYLFNHWPIQIFKTNGFRKYLYKTKIWSHGLYIELSDIFRTKDRHLAVSDHSQMISSQDFMIRIRPKKIGKICDFNFLTKYVETIRRYMILEKSRFIRFKDELSLTKLNKGDNHKKGWIQDKKGSRKMLSYKGYVAKIRPDLKNSKFIGRVVGINDLITFEGENLIELQEELEKSVDSYLDLCNELGIKAEKEYSGKITYRTDPKTHKKMVQVAAMKNISINTLIDNAIKNEIDKPSWYYDIEFTEDKAFTDELLAI